MKNLNTLFALFATVLLVSACGSQSSRDANSTSSASTATTTSTVSTGNASSLPAAYSTSATITGATGATPTYSYTTSATATLKVKIKPLPAPNLQISGYTNYVFPYGCLGVSVTVNGVTRATQELRVEGMNPSPQCANNPTFQVIDFSDVLTGSGPAKVTVSNAIYDNCRNMYNPFLYGCYLSQMWQNHVASMSVSVENDLTYFDETTSN